MVPVLKYTSLGNSGLKISVVGLGFWQAGSRFWGWTDYSSVSKSVIDGVGAALETNINFLDTAEVYGGGLSERVVGEAVRIHGRDNFIVASKVAGYRVTSGSIVGGVENINRRLGFTVDLIQLHWPPPYPWPLCWSIRGLEEAVSRGLAHYYGLSNFPSSLLEEALNCSRRFEPVSNQVQYSLAYRVPELKLKGLMERYNLALIAWSPLAKGALAGLREAKTSAQRGDKVFSVASSDSTLLDTVSRIAAKYNASMSQVALAWLIAKRAVPIPGFRDPSRVREYAGAARLRISEDDLEALDEVSIKYLRFWGEDYGELRTLRYIPAFIQRIAITLMGGI